MPYNYLNHTADLGIEITAESLKELFITTAKAIFEIQISGRISAKQNLSFELSASSIEELLIEWCRELLYNFSVKGFIPKIYNISIRKNLTLIAHLKGNKFDKKRHKIKLEIKNATYHNLSVRKIGNKYHATIIFDV